MKRPAQIFLCYARKDAAQVSELYENLSLVGFQPFMDIKDILPGEDWKLVLMNTIREAPFFLACLSSNSVDKRGVIQEEIHEALEVWRQKLDSDIYLIPVRLENCSVPSALAKFQWVDLFQDGDWNRLVKSLHERMDRLGLIKPVKLRSKPKGLSDEDIMGMIERRDFYDSQRNRSGKGLQHQYESIEQQGRKLVIDYTTGLMWQQSGSDNVMSSSQTTSYLKELNKFQFAGYSDWRLPTLEEAMSLIESTAKNGDLQIDSILTMLS